MGKPTFRDALTVYLKPRVLIVLFLGFSAGLPLALSGATLLVWMREATDLIRTEVGHMMKDVRLLGDRVKKLQTHFGQANEDLGNILISANRIEKRASKIEELEFDGDEAPAGNLISGTVRKVEAAE